MWVWLLFILHQLDLSLGIWTNSFGHRFMTSEADLDADIKSLSILSEHPELYAEFAKLGCVGSLIALLAHENTDIAIDAIEVLGELTDEDVEAEDTQWRALVDAMLDSDVVELLIQNLSRLDEEVESDRAGVFHVLGVLENLCSQQSIAENLGANNEGVIKWLLVRVRREEKRVGQNMQYAAEVLAILLQSSTKTRKKFAEMDGVDALLQILSAYRKKDPEKDSDEEEYVENLFDCLVCVVDETDGKEKFVEAEGVELCLIMLREGKMSKTRALRVLDHAMGRPAGGVVCERVVEAAGLKTIFGMFMKKQEKEAVEHLLGILSSLLRLLPGQSAARIRALAKFVEKDYEKIGKLMEVRREYTGRLRNAEEAIKAEAQQLSADERETMKGGWLSRRLDAGLFTLQTADVILSWLIAEDGGARSKVKKLLGEGGEDCETLKLSLKEQLDGIDAELSSEQAEVKEILGTLMQCL
jgi:beta-catenin-like protein 1